MEKTPITAQLWAQRNAGDAASEQVASLPNYDEYLVEKQASASRLTVAYNFKTEPSLRDLYVSHSGQILIGKIFEDLDALAGNIVRTHVANGSSSLRPLSLVTASVDKITKSKSIPTTDDLVMTGQVAWVGRSSLDVVIELHRTASIDSPDGAPGGAAQILRPANPSLLLSSIFTYVARDQRTGKAARVNSVTVETG